MIPADIQRRIEADYGSREVGAIAADIASFAEQFRSGFDEPLSDRLLRCLLHLAAGDRDSLLAHFRKALTDWRDVIQAAEYDATGARIRDFSLPFAERAAPGEGGPESVVTAFIAAMNSWELESWRASREARNTARPDSYWPGVRTGLDRVFAEFCTPRERPQGRQASFSASPEYDPAREKIVGSEIDGQRAHVDTQREAMLGGGLYRYVLHRRAGKWLIDSLKQRGDDQWERAIL